MLIAVGKWKKKKKKKKKGKNGASAVTKSVCIYNANTNNICYIGFKWILRGFFVLTLQAASPNECTNRAARTSSETTDLIVWLSV